MLDSFFAENPMAPTSRDSYSYTLTRFFSFCDDPGSCESKDVIKFLDSTVWGSALRASAVAAIRKYLRWRFGDSHPALRVRVKREPSKPGRTLNGQRVKQLLQSFDREKYKGKRDYAIACLALDTGLRVNELATLKLQNVEVGERRLVVKIKGGKWKEAVFSQHTADAISEWCNNRRLGDDRLFQITRDGLRVIVRRWGEKLGFRLSPHDFRRSFATLATKAGAPSRLVQIAGRWSSIEMVELYTSSLHPTDFDDFFPIQYIMN